MGSETTEMVDFGSINESDIVVEGREGHLISATTTTTTTVSEGVSESAPEPVVGATTPQTTTINVIQSAKALLAAANLSSASPGGSGDFKSSLQTPVAKQEGEPSISDFINYHAHDQEEIQEPSSESKSFNLPEDESMSSTYPFVIDTMPDSIQSADAENNNESEATTSISQPSAIADIGINHKNDDTTSQTPVISGWGGTAELGNGLAVAPKSYRKAVSSTDTPKISSTPNEAIPKAAGIAAFAGRKDRDSIPVPPQPDDPHAFHPKHTVSFHSTMAYMQTLPLGSRLFIGSLVTVNTSYEEVARLFAKFGNIVEISLKDFFGFVQFDTVEACVQAVEECQGMEFAGRKLELRVARDRVRGEPPVPARYIGPPIRSGKSRQMDNAQHHSLGKSSREDSVSSRFFSEERSRGHRSPPPPSGRHHPAEPSRRGRAADDGPSVEFRGRNLMSTSRSVSPPSRPFIRTPQPSGFRPPTLPARRYGPTVPEGQLIVIGSVSKNYINYVISTLSDYSRIDAIYLDDGLDFRALVEQYKAESVMALIFLERGLELNGKMALQILRPDGSIIDHEEVPIEGAKTILLAERQMRKSGVFPPPAVTAPLYGNPAVAAPAPVYRQSYPAPQPMYQQAPPPQQQPMLSAFSAAGGLGVGSMMYPQQQQQQQLQQGQMPFMGSQPVMSMPQSQQPMQGNNMNFMSNTRPDGTLDPQALLALASAFQPQPQQPQAPRYQPMGSGGYGAPSSLAPSGQQPNYSGGRPGMYGGGGMSQSGYPMQQQQQQQQRPPVYQQSFPFQQQQQQPNPMPHQHMQGSGYPPQRR